MNMEEPGFITLSDLFEIIVKAKKIIALSIFSFVVVSIIFLIFTTHKYVAEVTIGSNENALTQYTSQAGAGILGGVSGLLGGSEGGDFIKLTSLVTSPLVAKELLKNHQVLEIYYPTVWDESEEKWVPPSSVLSMIKAFVKEIFNRPGWTPPNEKTFSSLIKKDFSISGVGKTQLQKLSYAHKDPEVAKLMLINSLKIADGIFKQGNLSQVEDNIAYLEKRLPYIKLIEVKKELAAQLAKEEKKKMALESNLPYTYSQIGDVVIDTSPTKPSLGGIVFLGIFSGLFFGLVVTFIRYGSRARN